MLNSTVSAPCRASEEPVRAHAHRKSACTLSIACINSCIGGSKLRPLPLCSASLLLYVPGTSRRQSYTIYQSPMLVPDTDISVSRSSHPMFNFLSPVQREIISVITGRTRSVITQDGRCRMLCVRLHGYVHIGLVIMTSSLVGNRLLIVAFDCSIHITPT